MKKIAFGSDIGYGATKSCIKIGGKQTCNIFPSLIGRREELTMKPKNPEILERYSISFNGQSFYVGPLAETQSRYSFNTLYRDWIKESYYHALLYAAIGNAILPHLSDKTKTVVEGIDLQLVTGLPVDYFKEDAAILTEMLRGEHTFTMGDPKFGTQRTSHINISNPHVVPQPFGTYAGFIFGEDEELADRIAAGSVAIVDIGNNTTDLAEFYGGEYVDASGKSLLAGGAELTNIILNQVNKKFHANIERRNQTLVRAILETKKVRIRAEEHDISDIYAQAVEEVGSKILSFISENLQRESMLEAIIVTGGGSEIFFDFIKERYGHAIKANGRTELANVQGFWTLANEILAEEETSKAVEKETSIESSVPLLEAEETTVAAKPQVSEGL